MTRANDEAKVAKESKAGAQRLTIAVLRKTIREASLVCAALERMGHEAHPFGWSDPEKNAAITGMFFSAIDADEPDVRSEADREIAARRGVLSWLRTRVQFLTSPTPPAEPSLATQLLHDDFALTLEEQTALLDALGCIDRQTTGRGHVRAVRDSFETILRHVAELQRDALRWRESQKSAEHSDPAVVLGVEGQTGAFVVEAADTNAFETVEKPLRVGDAVRLAAGGVGVHTLASAPACMHVHDTWCEAVIVATETPSGIVTTVVPVAALEVVR